ncbi:MAG TPA: gaf sensor protein [Prolixibacteraceae bacterium]|jgi:GAF domain-containing protein|nr:gaf sensor protein [Prolixibacteraceae bacterium]
MTSTKFTEVYQKIEELVKNKPDDLLFRICELLKQDVYHYDWVGFYVLDPGNNELVLGPFVGKPTPHTHIAMGKGICGQVAESGQTMMVQDVTQVENYISCGLDVQSEIVVPVLKDGRFVAELDIDSHSPAPFTKADSEFLSKVCNLLTDCF